MLPPGKKFEFKFQWALILHQSPVENTLILRGFRADSIQEGAFLRGHLLLSVPKWPKYAYHNGYVGHDKVRPHRVSQQLAVCNWPLWPWIATTHPCGSWLIAKC